MLSVAPRPRAGQLLAAVVLPAFFLSTALAWLGRVEPPGVSESAATLEARLAVPNLQVVLLGNSKVHTDIDRAALTRALGLGADELVDLSRPGMSAPAFYATLAARVFAAGRTPSLILVYGAGRHLVETGVLSVIDERRITDQLGGLESPVLDRKVFGRAGGSTVVDRARQRSSALHTSLLETIRDAAVGLLAPAGEGTLLERGAAVAGPALARRFGADAPAGALTRGAGPIVEADAEASDRASSTRTPDDTLLPDLVALAHSHGSRIVFVRAPMRAGQDEVDPALIDGLVAELNSAGAGWVDLEALPLGDADFVDRAHMAPSGKAALTAALTDALVAMDPLHATALPPATPRLRAAAVEREGVPPEIVASSPTRVSGCAWRAGVPGLGGLSDNGLFTTGAGVSSPLRVRSERGELRAGAAPAAVKSGCTGLSAHHDEVLAWAAQDEGEAGWNVGLDAAFPILGGVPAWWVYPGTTARWRFETPWDPASGPFVVTAQLYGVDDSGAKATLRVRDDAGERTAEFTGGRFPVATLEGDAPRGPWAVEVGASSEYFLVERLQIGRGSHRAVLVGGPPQGMGLLALRPAADEVVLAEGAPSPEGRLDLPVLAACSPVRLAVEGQAWRRRGRLGGEWSVDATGVGVPGPGGQTLAVSLAAARKCHGGSWFYPGDRSVWSLDWRLAHRVRGPVSAIVVTGTGFGDGAGLELEWVVAGEVAAAFSVAPGELTGGSLRLELPSETTSGKREVRVKTAAGSWFYLHDLRLVDARPALPGDEGGAP